MSDLEDRYLVTPVIDEVEDPKISLPYPIAIGVSGKYFCTMRPRLISKCLNPLDDPLTISFGANCLKFLCR